MKGQFVIIDLNNMDIMRDKNDKIVFYDTENDARDVCGMYEFENVWIMKLIHNHVEQNINNF
jgi:hypothetical protein